MLREAGSVLVGCLGFYVASALGASAPLATIGAAIFSLPITIYYAATIVPRAWRAVFDPDTSTSKGVVSVFGFLTAMMLIVFSGVFISGGSPALLLIGFSIQLAFGLWMFARLLIRPN